MHSAHLFPCPLRIAGWYHFIVSSRMHFRLIQTGTADYEAMASLRNRVLLAPIGVPRSYINPEKEAADLLVGAFDGDALVGCCVLTRVDENTVQLRQMAVESNRQQKGIGAAVVAFAEATAREHGYQTLMLHARDTVIAFYEKCGYHTYGQPFEEVGIGHHKMQKHLTP